MEHRRALEPRRLSYELHQDAVSYGLSLLDRNRARRRRQHEDSAYYDGENDLEYLGDRVVYLVEENGQLHSVQVTREMGG